MVPIEDWTADLLNKLQRTLGDRLLFFGLQGSYCRGEAREESDIDIVILLDQLHPADFEMIRPLILTGTEGDKACGFIADTEIIRHWPRHKIFQFYRDTKPLYSSLDPFLPPYTEEDIRYALHLAASGIYHTTTHALLFEKPGEQFASLTALYKSIFFPLQLAHYLRSGNYIKTKRELLTVLEKEEKGLLETSLFWEKHRNTAAKNPGPFFTPLLHWSRQSLLQL